jgi:hypothetical protein
MDDSPDRRDPRQRLIAGQDAPTYGWSTCTADAAGAAVSCSEPAGAHPHGSVTLRDRASTFAERTLPPFGAGRSGGVSLVNGETRRHGRRPLGEQPHRLTRSDRREPALRLLVRNRQREDRVLLLARHPKGRPAARHDPEAPSPAQQFRHDRSCWQQVLEIVQDDQELPVPQVTHQVLHQRPVPRIRQPDALGDR